MKRLYIKPELSSTRINSTTMLAGSGGVDVNQDLSTPEQLSKKFGGLVEDDFEGNDNNNQVDY